MRAITAPEINIANAMAFKGKSGSENNLHLIPLIGQHQRTVIGFDGETIETRFVIFSLFSGKSETDVTHHEYHQFQQGRQDQQKEQIGTEPKKGAHTHTNYHTTKLTTSYWHLFSAITWYFEG